MNRVEPLKGESCMFISLKKTNAAVSVAYSDGDFSNNLSGADFKIEKSAHEIVLSVDLGQNFKVRNKAQNDFLDATHLEEKLGLLSSLSVNDQQVASGVEKAISSYPAASFRLELVLRDAAKVSLKAKPVVDAGSVQFQIEAE